MTDITSLTNAVHKDTHIWLVSKFDWQLLIWPYIKETNFSSFS